MRIQMNISAGNCNLLQVVLSHFLRPKDAMMVKDLTKCMSDEVRTVEDTGYMQSFLCQRTCVCVHDVEKVCTSGGLTDAHLYCVSCVQVAPVIRTLNELGGQTKNTKKAVEAADEAFMRVARDLLNLPPKIHRMKNKPVENEAKTPRTPEPLNVPKDIRNAIRALLFGGE